MLFSCQWSRCAGSEGGEYLARDFDEVIACFDRQIDTGAEVWCIVWDGREWFQIASYDNVPASDWIGNPISPRDGILWFDPSSEYAVRLSRALDVRAEPRTYE
jgi:hypothetical protein